MTATKEDKSVFSVALNQVKAQLNESTAKDDSKSEYFIHAKKNEYILFRSLSETKKFFEQEATDELKALLKLSNCESFTSENFHAVLLTAVKLLLQKA